jgi:hypothetical protein
MARRLSPLTSRPQIASAILSPQSDGRPLLTPAARRAALARSRKWRDARERGSQRFYRMIDGAGAISLAATRVGSPVEPASKPPRVMPARNTISIVAMTAPARGGAPLIARSCFSKSSWSCWSIGRNSRNGKMSEGNPRECVAVPLPRVEVSPRFASQQPVCDAQVSVGERAGVGYALLRTAIDGEAEIAKLPVLLHA